jgi:intracellular sulfur oxidation DsrE/DsrF family protein
MHRRNMITALIAGIGGIAAAAGASVRAKAEPAKPDKLKVAYHLADLDKVDFVLGNIQNHIDGVGGPDKVTIAVVVHGPALKAFHAIAATPTVAERLQKFSKAGVKLNACGNTMSSQKVTLADLLPGFVKADEGGVVRLAELQAEGYVYLRP